LHVQHVLLLAATTTTTLHEKEDKKKFPNPKKKLKVLSHVKDPAYIVRRMVSPFAAQRNAPFLAFKIIRKKSFLYRYRPNVYAFAKTRN
jgi:hypothetical protein